MRDVTRDNFGLTIAYLLPGFVALWGTAYHVPAVRPWLQSAPDDAPTVGGFLYATLASTALGMVLSGVRWAVVDRALGHLGVRPPRWDFTLFSERLAAYELLVANHYRYYQFYANMLVALAYAYVARLLSPGDRAGGEWAIAAVFLLVEAVLFACSWDTLGKYYARTEALLAPGGCGEAAATRSRRGPDSARRGGPPRGRAGPRRRRPGRTAGPREEAEGGRRGDRDRTTRGRG